MTKWSQSTVEHKKIADRKTIREEENIFIIKGEYILKRKDCLSCEEKSRMSLASLGDS